MQFATLIAIVDATDITSPTYEPIYKKIGVIDFDNIRNIMGYNWDKPMSEYPKEYSSSGLTLNASNLMDIDYALHKFSIDMWKLGNVDKLFKVIVEGKDEFEKSKWFYYQQLREKEIVGFPRSWKSTKISVELVSILDKSDESEYYPVDTTQLLGCYRYKRDEEGYSPYRTCTNILNVKNPFEVKTLKLWDLDAAKVKFYSDEAVEVLTPEMNQLVKDLLEDIKERPHRYKKPLFKG